MKKNILLYIPVMLIFTILISCSPTNQAKPQQNSTAQQTPGASVPKTPAVPSPQAPVSPSPAPSPKPSASPAPKTPAPPSPAPSTQSFRFVFMGDSRGSDNGVNSKIVKKTLERIKLLSPQPKFAVMAGDLVDGAKSYNGVKSELAYFKKIITAYYPISFFYPGIGNHETANNSGGEKAFGEVFSEFKATFLDSYGRTAYFFDHGNSRFFMLDSDYPGELHKISDKQLVWVKANQNKSAEHNLYFLHEPPYPTGANVGFSLDKNPLQRAKLLDLIDSTTGPVIFCSHEHNYTRRHINSDFNTRISGIDFKFGKTVYQLTSGGFGAPLYTGYTSKKDVDLPPVVDNNFVVVDITGPEVSVQVYNLEGKLLDSFKQTNK